ncbi:MAG: hypothetical protein ACRELW_19415, partial [Candidatus Rokuibacteriota bacterium]
MEKLAVIIPRPAVNFPVLQAQQRHLGTSKRQLSGWLASSGCTQQSTSSDEPLPAFDRLASYVRE